VLPPKPAMSPQNSREPSLQRSGGAPSRPKM
jgi:hypothetical protein